MQQTSTWQDRLKDSSWVTIAWEWLQTLLGRAVDAVLWITMIFACYQLIPGAPQPPTALSVFMFISQFVALDIGGLGLNQMARRQGLPQWDYARIIAYCLIGITLITITYAGIEHAVPSLDPQVTVWVEVTLVVARSVMTVLYGQAIHSLKAEEHERESRVAELEQEVSNLRVQLENGQAEVSNLTTQLDSEKQKVSNLTVQLSNEKQKVQSLQEKRNRTQKDEKEGKERVIHLDTNRMRRSRQDAEEKEMVEAIRNLLKAEPELSGRAIATRVGCSPTTAAKWKELIEKEASDECVND